MEVIELLENVIVTLEQREARALDRATLRGFSVRMLERPEPQSEPTDTQKFAG
jgi:hypothetical protein